MFIVKAEYRGVTRKFSYFNFPSWDSLRQQIIRVFNIDRFYLSTITYSAEAGSKVLIALEAHNAAQYNNYASPFTRNTRGILRFTINDEFIQPTLDAPRASIHIEDGDSVMRAPSPSQESRLYEDPEEEMMRSKTPVLPPGGSNRLSTISTQSCCDVHSSKQEIHQMMQTFLSDFNRTLSSTFGTEDERDSPSSETQPNMPGAFNSTQSSNSPPQSQEPLPTHPGVWCDHCNNLLKGVRFKCAECWNFDLCSSCVSTHNAIKLHNTDRTHRFHVMPTPNSGPIPSTISTATSTSNSAANQRAHSARNPPPRIHGAACDRCSQTIVGDRHKCLDCPDFDLCSECFEFATTMHPVHKFIKIEMPGEIVIHRVYEDQPAPTKEPIVHQAACDMCELRIVGDRFKCTNCPDFDVCKSCFRIVPDQHPKHAFVKITDPADIMFRSTQVNPVLHSAVCDGCNKQIMGPRFKCMHPDCPDTDFCQHCEALPFATHPKDHPLVKLNLELSQYSGLRDVFAYIKKTKQSRSAAIALLSTPPQRPPVDSFANWSPPVLQPPTIIRVPSPPIVYSGPIMGPVPPVQPIVVMPPEPTVIRNLSSPPLSPSRSSSIRYVCGGRPAFPSVGSSTGSIRGVLNSESGEMSPTREIPMVVQLPLIPTNPPTPVFESIVVHPISPIHRPAPSAPQESVSDISYLERQCSPPMAENMHGITLSSVVIPASASLPEDIPQTASVVSPGVDLISRPDSAASSPFSDIHQIAQSIDPTPRATFLSDNNIPDGQVVLAGAQFVKSWLMQNNGDVAWSEGTEIVFVAGDRLGGGEGAPMSYEVGRVEPGSSVDVNVMDMQAPEEPGKYLSFWRLRDNEGNFFGHRVWCDIVVPEPESSGSSVAASSVIMMPTSAPSLTTANVASMEQQTSGIPLPEPSRASFTLPSISHGPNSVALTNTTSTIESDDVSEDSDASLWAETRPTPAVAESAHHGGDGGDGDASEDEAEFILVSDRSSTDGF